MKGLILAIFIFTMGSCTSWQTATQTTLAATHTATKQLSNIVEPHYRAKCKAKAIACKDEGDTICQPLVSCQKERRTINQAIITLHTTISLGYSFLVLKDEKKAGLIVDKVLLMFRDINNSLIKMGVYK